MTNSTRRQDSPRRPLVNRRNLLRLLAAGTIGSLVEGFAIEPALLSVTRREVPCRQLPAGLDGLKVALLSDFHFRPDQDADLIDKVVEQVAIEKPDLIMLGGDYMSGDPGVVPPLVKKLEKLQARHGVFAVMGNHDGWAGSRSVVRRQFEKAGISFMINQHSLLNIRGESLAVAGTDFVWLGKPDPAATMGKVPRKVPVVALVHEPDYFDTMISEREVMLQLSGHSHGGQCQVPIIGYAPKTVRYGTKYVEGHFASGGSNLFVTRGVGTTGPRVRFACPPELAMLTLRTSDGSV